jgi:hypothetical protein
MDTLTMSLAFIIIYIALLSGWMIIWISTLIHMAKRKRWGWFILSLIFNLPVLIYWTVWLCSKKFRNKRAR